MYKRLFKSFFSSEFLVLGLPDKLMLRQSWHGLAGLLAHARVYELEDSPTRDLDSSLRQLRALCGPKPGDRWFLGLPLKHFTMVNFTLPQAARENLQQAVRYALMRHVPFDLEQVHFQYQEHRREDLLEISAVVTPMEFIQPFVQPFTEQGLTLYSLFPAIMHWAWRMGDGVYVLQRGGYCEALVYQGQRIKLHSWNQAAEGSQSPDWSQAGTLLQNVQEMPSTLYVCQSEQDPEEVQAGLEVRFQDKQVLNLEDKGRSTKETVEPAGFGIDLLPAAVRRRETVMSYLVLGSLIFFLLTLLAWPVSNLAGQKRYLTKLETKIQELNTKAEDLRQMRDESSQILDQLQDLAELKSSYASSLDILRELSEVTPESAWLYSIKYTRDRITMQGEAQSATRVIEALENSSFFKEVGFSSPVTRSGGKERFSLEAKVEI